MRSTTDTLQRFIFEDIDIRGQLICLGASFQTIIEQHQYPKQIRQLLGETILSAVLLSSIIKYEGNLTIQMQATGPVNLLVAKCTSDYHIRGLVQYDADALSDDILENIGDGKLIVTISPDNKVKPYQSIIPLNGNKISESLEFYFSQSEQLATKIWLAVDEHRAAGMLLQLMPGQSTQDRELFWEYAIRLGDTISDQELLNEENTTILHRLYHENDLRLFEAQPVSFRCQCSEARMRDAVKTLGYQEAMEVVRDKQQIVVTCEYCNHSYAFDKVDVEAMFRE